MGNFGPPAREALVHEVERRPAVGQSRHTSSLAIVVNISWMDWAIAALIPGAQAVGPRGAARFRF
jgi:hypothetical protein